MPDPRARRCARLPSNARRTETGLHQSAAFLIATNVVQGDTLSGHDSRGQEIQFSWWNRIEGAPGMVQREPFTFASLRDSAINYVQHAQGDCDLVAVVIVCSRYPSAA